MLKVKRKKIVIIGGGGHARVLWDMLSQDKSQQVLGYADHSAVAAFDLPYLGTDADIVAKFTPKEVQLVNGLGSTISTEKRAQIFQDFKNQGYYFASVIHPCAIVSARVELKEGVQVMAGAVINTGTVIGNNVIVNTAASLDHDVLVGDHSHIAPGVTISGGVKISQGCHVGTGASVVQGVRIGKDALVAAGAVVTADVPDGKRVQGVPARIYEGN